jgi:hypothetical protein
MPSRYDNCYTILEDVRLGLNEYTTAYMQGTDTSGTFNNADIVRKINAAQRFIWHILFTRFPELFFTSIVIPGNAGVYLLPVDLFMIHMLQDANGFRLGKIPLRVKRTASQGGSDYNYYRYGNNIIRDGGGSDSLTLYYYSRVKDLTQGCSTAGGAGTVTLDSSAAPEIYYYNGIRIDNITDATTDTITSYTALRVATVTNTWAASKYYGTVSELPEPFHSLIAPKAVITMKLNPTSPEKPSAQELADFQMNLTETLRAFTGTYASDITMDEIFYDFSPYY